MKGYVHSKVEGVEAYVDRYIAKDDSLLFCSCFAGANSVKGVQAGFLVGSIWVIENEFFKRASNTNYRRLMQNVSINTAYGIVFAETFFSGKEIATVNIICGDTESEVREQAFARLKRYSCIPLLDSWREFVLNEMVSFIPLECFGFNKVYEIELPNDEALKEFVMSNLNYLKTL